MNSKVALTSARCFESRILSESTVSLIYVSCKEAVYIRVSGTRRRTAAGARRRRKMLSASTVRRGMVVPLEALHRDRVARLDGNTKLVLDSAVSRWRKSATVGRVDCWRRSDDRAIGQLAVGQRIGGRRHRRVGSGYFRWEDRISGCRALMVWRRRHRGRSCWRDFAGGHVAGGRLRRGPLTTSRRQRW